MKGKQLIRPADDRVLLGVSSGLASYFNIDPVLVRLAFVLLGLASAGQTILLYLLLAIIMPSEPMTVAKAHPFDEEEIVIDSAA